MRRHPAIPLPAALILAWTSPLAAAESLPLTSTPVPGGVALVPLGDAEQAPRVRYRGERVLVRRSAQGWQAVVGIPLSAKPGRDALEAEGRTVRFTIQTKRYPEQRLTVKNKRQVNPNAEDAARIAREQILIAPTWKEWPEGLTASLRFHPPTAGKLSSSFGLRRFFNGEARAPHPGLDIAAPAGQIVRAPADGIVVLTGDFFFSGNSVFLAHGEGVVSLLCHLSQIEVKPGQTLKTGAILGRVGMTGRATGPHLHWTLSMNNARVDPRLFLRKP